MTVSLYNSSPPSRICQVGDGVLLNLKLPVEFAFGQGISKWQGEKGWVSRFWEEWVVRSYGSWELLRHKSLEIILTSEPRPIHSCLLAHCHQSQTHLLFFHQPSPLPLTGCFSLCHLMIVIDLYNLTASLVPKTGTQPLDAWAKWVKSSSLNSSFAFLI